MGYLGFEVRRLLRIRALLMTGTLLPLGIYLAFTLLGRDDMSELYRGIPLSAVVMVSVAGVGAMIGVLTHSAGVAHERADHWLWHLRVTPMPPSRVVLVRAVVSLLTVPPPVVAIAVAATVLHGLRLPPGRWLLLVTVMWLGAVPFALLGLAFGFMLTRELVGPVTMGAWLVLAFTGGLFMPVESFPAWLRLAAELMPTFRYSELGWAAVGGGPPVAAGLAVLGAWTVLFGGLAAWAYRRATAVR